MLQQQQPYQSQKQIKNVQTNTNFLYQSQDQCDQQQQSQPSQHLAFLQQQCQAVKNSDSVDTQTRQQVFQLESQENELQNIQQQQCGYIFQQQRAIYWNNNFSPPSFHPNFLLNHQDLNNISSIHLMRHQAQQFSQQQQQQQQKGCFMSQSFSLVSISSNASLKLQRQSQEIADLFLNQLFLQQNEEQQQIQKVSSHPVNLENHNINTKKNEIDQQQLTQDENLPDQSKIDYNQTYLKELYSSTFSDNQSKCMQINNQSSVSLSSNSQVSMNSGSDKENIIPLYCKKVQNYIEGWNQTRKVQLKVELGNSFIHFQPEKKCYEIPLTITLTDKLLFEKFRQANITQSVRSSIDFLFIVDNNIETQTRTRFFSTIFDKMLNSDRIAIIANDLQLQPNFVQSNKQMREIILDSIKYDLTDNDNQLLDLEQALDIAVNVLTQRKNRNIVTTIIIFANETKQFTKSASEVIASLKHLQNTQFFALTCNQKFFWEINQYAPLIQPYYNFKKLRNINKVAKLIFNCLANTLIQNIDVYIELQSDCENDQLIMLTNQGELTQINKVSYRISIKSIQLHQPKILFIATLLKLGTDQCANNTILSSQYLHIRSTFQSFLQEKCCNFICEPVYTINSQISSLNIPLVFQRENTNLLTSLSVYSRAFLNQLGNCILQNEELDKDCLCFYIKLFSDKKNKKESKQFNAILQKTRQYYVQQKCEAIQTLGNYLQFGIKTWLQKILTCKKKDDPINLK